MAEGVPAEPVPDLPRYGHGSLAEVVPSLLSARGVEGFDDALGIEPIRGLCLFVVDGLGWEHILRFGDAAPPGSRSASAATAASTFARYSRCSEEPTPKMWAVVSSDGW